MNIPADAMWWWSCDDENFHGPFDTREAAIAEGKGFGSEHGCYVCQATEPHHIKLSYCFDAEYFLDAASDDCAYMMGPDSDPLFDPKEDQVADLQAMVRAAIDIWQEKHRLVFVPWRFDWQGPREWISTKPDEEGSAE